MSGSKGVERENSELEDKSSKRVRWTKKENKLLLRRVAACRSAYGFIDWKKVSKGSGRSPSACKKQYKRLCQYNEMMLSWNRMKDEKLMDLAHKHDCRWSLISAKLRDFKICVTSDFCRERYFKLLSKTSKLGEFRANEYHELTILDEAQELINKFADQLSSQFTLDHYNLPPNI